MATNTKKKSDPAPETAPLLEPQENLLSVQYQPAEGAICDETPPRFQWIPPQVGQWRYDLEIQPLSESGEDSGAALCFDNIPFAFFTGNAALPAGAYRWRYRLSGTQPSNWSRSRRFRVSDQAAQAPFTFDQRRATGLRPRLALAPDGHAALRTGLGDTPTWQAFRSQSVAKWIDRDPPAEPAPYPGDKRDPRLWRQSYIACQEALYGIRNLAIAGVLEQDAALIAQAKHWVLAIAGWDPEGPTSRSYNDEAAFRVAVALAWGYDWLRTELSDEEAETVRRVLHARGAQVAHHVMHAARIDTFPYDSHAVRAVSAVLVPVGLALAGEDEAGSAWLDYAAGYLAGPYSAWADGDGGWAEGIHYWTTAMCYALEAAVLLRNATGLDLFQRPFFRHTGNFPLFARPAKTRRATFGDDSTLGDPPSPKIGRNMRLLAAATQTPEFAGYADQIDAFSDSDEAAFYNYGWWDLRFDDLLREASFPPVEGAPMPAAPGVKAFEGVGWAALHARMDDPDEQLHCVFKSSPYGSISHSHADQNAFCLSAFGEDLLIQSGHYVAHHSTMHRNWRRQTISKNALLIDGQGQYGGDDKLKARRATGLLTGHGGSGGHVWVEGDATAAYQSLTPDVEAVQRRVHLVHGAAFVVVDRVRCARERSLQWLAHTEAAISLGERAATLRGRAVDAGIEVVFSSASIGGMHVIEGFEGVSPKEYAGLAPSRRLQITLGPARDHTLAVMITPVRKGVASRVLGFVEDQGFGKQLYCLCENQDPICIPIT